MGLQKERKKLREPKALPSPKADSLQKSFHLIIQKTFSLSAGVALLSVCIYVHDHGVPAVFCVGDVSSERPQVLCNSHSQQTWETQKSGSPLNNVLAVYSKLQTPYVTCLYYSVPCFSGILSFLTFYLQNSATSHVLESFTQSQLSGHS